MVTPLNIAAFTGARCNRIAIDAHRCVKESRKSHAGYFPSLGVLPNEYKPYLHTSCTYSCNPFKAARSLMIPALISTTVRPAAPASSTAPPSSTRVALAVSDSFLLPALQHPAMRSVGVPHDHYHAPTLRRRSARSVATCSGKIIDCS